MSLRILVLSHQGLGDLICTLPIYYALQQKSGRVVFSVVANRAAYDLMRHYQIAAKVFMVNPRSRLAFAASLFWLLWRIRPNEIISPIGVNPLKSILLFFMYPFARATIFSNGRFTLVPRVESVRINGKASRVYNHNLYAEKLSSAYFYPLLGDRETVEISERTKVIVHPGSGEAEAHKRLPLSYYAAIIEYLLAKEIEVVLLSGEIDCYLCDELIKISKSSKMLKNLCGKLTIKETIQHISRSKFLISADSGLMHLANALSIPTLTFFGPTSLTELTHSPTMLHSKFLSLSLPCAPCYPDLKYGCGNPICMTNFSIEKIKSDIDYMMSI